MERLRMHLWPVPLWLVWVTALCTVGDGAAQSLRASAAGGSPGAWVVVQLSLEPASGQQLVGLQFEAVVPRPLEMEGQGARILLAAKDAGKSLTCAVAGKSAETQLLRCLVVGGQKAIPAGPLAVLSLKIGEKAPPGTVRIRFEHALAVTRDLKQLPVEPLEAAVVIRAGR